jgi:hypothetical protein
MQMPAGRAPLWLIVAGVALGAAATRASGQAAPGSGQDAPPGILPGVKVGGSPNIHLIGHLPLGSFTNVLNAEIEQEPSRPYAYLSQGLYRTGFTIIDLHDLSNVHAIYQWRIENLALHQPAFGGQDGKYFKFRNRYYFVVALQFNRGRRMPIWAP